MNGELEEHLQNIEDYIKIDDKIVTYKWISKVLKVHTNTAKQLLFAFSKKSGPKDSLLVTYIVSGELRDGDGLSFSLVQENDLEKTKKKFHRVTSVHVYSIQRGTVVCGADIYNAEKSYELTSEDHAFRSIQPSEEIKRREIKSMPSNYVQNASSVSLASKKAPTVSQTIKTSSNGSVPSVVKDISPKKTINKEKPINGTKKASPKKNDKDPSSGKDGGIGAMFKKQTAKNEEAAAKADAKEKENIESTKTVSKDVNNISTSDKDSTAPEPDVKTPVNKPKSQSRKKRKNLKGTKESAPKRRKRIQRVSSDSESSNEESDGDERYPSPEPEPEPTITLESEEEEIIPATPLEKGRQRVRKLVDRTFEDEDGYIITKKDYVFESCSDDESGEPTKKKDDLKGKTTTANEKSETNPRQEMSPPAPVKAQKNNLENTAKTNNKPGRPSKTKTNVTDTSKKQVSITSFFKKK